MSKPNPTQSTVELLLALAPVAAKDEATASAFETLRERLLSEGAAEVVEESINRTIEKHYSFEAEHRTEVEVETFTDFFYDAIARVGLCLDIGQRGDTKLGKTEMAYLRSKVEDVLKGRYNTDKLTVALLSDREISEQRHLTWAVEVTQKLLDVGKPSPAERRRLQRERLDERIARTKHAIEPISRSIEDSEKHFRINLAEARDEQVALLAQIEGSPDDVEFVTSEINACIASIDDQIARGCPARIALNKLFAELGSLEVLLATLSGMEARGGDESLPDDFLETVTVPDEFVPKTWKEISMEILGLIKEAKTNQQTLTEILT